MFWGLEELGLLNSYSHAIDDLQRRVPMWLILLAGVIIVPFVEELVFRYGLRFKKGLITIMPSLLVIVAVIYGFYYLPLIGALLLMALLVSALVFYFTKIDIITHLLNHLWTRRYGIVFYLVALIFGLVHITNYTDFNYASAAILLVPVLVAPQFIGGLLIGYMRVKYGFFWGYYLHAGSNAFLFTIGIIFISEIEEKINISKDNYTIKVEEHLRKSSNDSMVKFVKNDSVSIINYSLHDVIHVLLNKDRSAGRQNSILL